MLLGRCARFRLPPVCSGFPEGQSYVRLDLGFEEIPSRRYAPYSWSAT